MPRADLLERLARIELDSLIRQDLDRLAADDDVSMITFDIEPSARGGTLILWKIGEVRAWAREHHWQIVVTTAENPRQRCDPNREDVRCLLFRP